MRGLAIAAAVVAASAFFVAVPAEADTCPQAEVVFARGTNEPVGVGVVGQAFVDALRADTADSVGLYAVNYPASTDYPTAAQGVVDADNHVRAIIANCPSTRIILGGYSQGAGIMDLLTSDGSLAGSSAMPGLPGPLAPDVADHVAAVALFGKPSDRMLSSVGIERILPSSLFTGKTIDLCIDGDPICTDNSDGSIVPHLLYGINGMAAQAADFAARRL